MRLSAEIRNQKELTDLLGKLAGGELRKAYALALNDTGFMVRGKQVAALNGAFDRVTPFVGRSPKVFKATAEKLSVSIAPTLHTDRSAFVRGGKVGVDPQDVLQAQAEGGRRRDKRSEVILRRAGILPNGMQTSIPKTPYPGSDDGRGNLRGPFLVQLISYLQAFGEQGYRANMTARRKRNLQRGTAKQVGRRYFVSYGRLRGHHLAAGIWAASGTHGVDVRPVVMFVRSGTYRPRIDMDRVARDAGVQEYLDKRVRFRVREAARLGRYVEPEPSKRIRQRWLVYEHKARRNGLSECAKAIQTGLDWATKRAEELGLSSSNILIYTDTGGGGAKMLPDLRNVYKLPVVAAYKRDKKAAIEMLQDDVREGRFMVPADGAFSQESQAIVWTKDPDTGEVIREIDDKQYHPDLMDAILYAMRAVWVQSLIK